MKKQNTVGNYLKLIGLMSSFLGSTGYADTPADREELKIRMEEENSQSKSENKPHHSHKPPPKIENKKVIKKLPPHKEQQPSNEVQTQGVSGTSQQNIKKTSTLIFEGKAIVPEMVVITGACFQMGSPESEAERGKDERQHEVCIDSFEMGKYEITQAQWQTVMGSNPSVLKGDNLPVEYVSWNDVQTFIEKLNSKTNKKYRLPTEAEWEYAARAGTKTPFYTGDCINTEQANYNGDEDYNNCGAKTGVVKGMVAVASYSPNQFGLYDTAGNVLEWTGSFYEANYNNASETRGAVNTNNIFAGAIANFALQSQAQRTAQEQQAFRATQEMSYRQGLGILEMREGEEEALAMREGEKSRTVRGGAFFSNPSGLRSAFRSARRPDSRSIRIGFRLARNKLTDDELMNESMDKGIKDGFKFGNDSK